MEELVNMIECIEDIRQESKVRYPIKEIVVIVLCATLANEDEWEYMEIWANENKSLLQEYLELKNGIPSHDTLRRVMGMINPIYIQEAQNKWNEMLNTDEGEKLKKLICIDGKTMRGNTRKGSKPNHIVSAWSKNDGFCLGQKATNDKSNEITVIPQLLDMINIKNSIITIDAMGTQREIVKKIRSKKADYVLALKSNQNRLFNDVSLYFQDNENLEQIKKSGNYLKSIEKNHGMADIREYYQTDDISWIDNHEIDTNSKKKVEKWKNLKSIGMVVHKHGNICEIRYFISSLLPNIEIFADSIRGHWSVESMHWQLDVTFKEDSNKTLDKIASQNQNIIRKWCLSILKIAKIGKPKQSMRGKRKIISYNPMKYLDYVLSI